MNALEILGLACVDKTFRKRLFSDVKSVIADNRADLTWAEEEGLKRITQPHCPPRKPDAAKSSLSNGPVAPQEPNTLAAELEDVGNAVMKMCPEAPCPWPTYFTQNEK